MEYIHGGDIYRYPVEYDFSVNINPLGMPLGSISAAHEGIVLSGRYPDYSGEKLCRAIAGHENIPSWSIVLGNGAAELIYALCHAVRPVTALTVAPTFQEYASAVCAAGGEMRYCYLHEADDFSVTEELLDSVTEDIDILFLCNPNNPTGMLAEPDLMQRLIRRCAACDTLLCIDESFLPFVEDAEKHTAMKYLSEDKGCLVVLRSFTKIYGMPGLRLGYMAFGDMELRERVRSNIQPWNTSVPAQMAGIEALKDIEFLEKTRDMLHAERNYLETAMRGHLTKKMYPGCANFILFCADDGLGEDLLEQGIMIRDCSGFEGLSQGYYRIGIRSHSENQMLIRQWNQIRL
ncbi:MAG: pyridoxal phosphate-dependent aminotransferase [Wujia sp.]